MQKEVFSIFMRLAVLKFFVIPDPCFVSLARKEQIRR